MYNMYCTIKTFFVKTATLFKYVPDNLNQNPKIILLYYLKDTVQRKLTGVLSGIHRKLTIFSIVAGIFFLIFMGFVPLNSKKNFLVS
jgi:hypothetical protein